MYLLETISQNYNTVGRSQQKKKYQEVFLQKNFAVKINNSCNKHGLFKRCNKNVERFHRIAKNVSVQKNSSQENKIFERTNSKESAILL